MAIEKNNVISYDDLPKINNEVHLASCISATVDLTIGGWSSKKQTINVTGVTTATNIIVAPHPDFTEDFIYYNIVAEGQGAGTVTFRCTTTPDKLIKVNLLLFIAG